MNQCALAQEELKDERDTALGDLYDAQYTLGETYLDIQALEEELAELEDYRAEVEAAAAEEERIRQEEEALRAD